MKKSNLRSLILNKKKIASLSNLKTLMGGTVSLADNGGVLYDIHTNPLDTNTNPLPTAVDTNTNVGDTITEITETAPAATVSDPIGGTTTSGPPPMGGTPTMLC